MTLFPHHSLSDCVPFEARTMIVDCSSDILPSRWPPKHPKRTVHRTGPPI